MSHLESLTTEISILTSSIELPKYFEMIRKFDIYIDDLSSGLPRKELILYTDKSMSLLIIRAFL